jgi:hypothetical protein
MLRDRRSGVTTASYGRECTKKPRTLKEIGPETREKATVLSVLDRTITLTLSTRRERVGCTAMSGSFCRYLLAAIP